MTKPASRGASHPTAVAASAVEPSVTTWEEFEGQVAVVLAHMAVDSYFVLSTTEKEDESSYYVQFAQGGKAGLLAEAVSNAYLAGTRALSPAQEEQLGDLGWQSPPPRARHELNFSRQWPMPAPFTEVAQLAVSTLREVYGIERPTRLQYRRFALGGPDFAEPALDIDAVAPSTPRTKGQPAAPTLAELTPMVEAALKAFLHTDVLVHDKDGDIPVRMGSAVVFVRTVDGTPPMVRIFSPILRDIAGSPGLLEALNQINSTMPLGRVFWTGQTVIAATEVPALGITPDQVAFACLQLGGFADRLDDELHDRFGGTTAFGTGPKLLN